MPDFEQVQAWIGGTTAASQRQIPIRESALSVAASGVIADPNWKLYADHLAGLKKRFEDIQIGQKNALLGAEVLTHEKYAQLKSDSSYAKGYVQAMDDAITMIKTLVDNNKTQE